MRMLKSMTLFCVFLLSHQGIFADIDQGERAEQNEEALGSLDFHEKDESSPHEDVTASIGNFNLLESGGRHPCCSDRCDQVVSLGDSGFFAFGQTQWYTINVPGFPNFTLLSKNRNTGFTQGGLCLTPNGFIIKDAGTYFVNFQVILQNPNMDTAIITLLVGINDVFDIHNFSKAIGSVIFVPSGNLNSIQLSGILRNMQAGTKISIIATDSGSPGQILSVVRWDINLFKLDDPR